MTDRIRVPRDLDISTRFFGRFTPKDLARIGTPLLVAAALVPREASTETLVGGLAALTVAAVWYVWKPRGRHLDTHLYHGLRFLTTPNQEDSQTRGINTDHIVLEDGTKAAIIQVDPTNLELKTQDEQAALHAIYKELLGSLEHPVEIHSRQRGLDLEAYTDNIWTEDPDHEDLKDGYLKWCYRLADGSLTATDHYIVVKSRSGNTAWLKSLFPSNLLEESVDEGSVDELTDRCRRIINSLESSELSATRLEGRHLSKAVEQFPSPGETDRELTADPENPESEYAKTLYISELPSGVGIGWVLRVLQAEGITDVTQVIRPRSPSKTASKLQRVSEKLNAEIDSLLSQGYRGTNKLESSLDDAEWMQDLIADRKDTPVDYGVYITVHHRDEKRCRTVYQAIKNRLETMRTEVQHPYLRTDQAADSWHPLRPDGLDETQLMPASSAAAGFPFGTQDLDQNTGVIYGTTTADNTPILLDRFEWSSHSMARMGMVGSGKSYAAKLETIRMHLAYDDVQTFIVDPKQEYSRVIRALGGQVFTLSPGEIDLKDLPIHTADVVGFEVEERGQRENVEVLNDTVEHIYQAVSQDTDRTHVVIDEARILLNDEDGRRLLNQFVLEGRDTNTAVTLISQNASHFTYCREGREILDNMPGKVFMRHDRVPEDVVDYFNLSTREKQQLYELKTGTDADHSEAILKISGRLDTRVKVESTPEEHALVTEDRR